MPRLNSKQRGKGREMDIRDISTFEFIGFGEQVDLDGAGERIMVSKLESCVNGTAKTIKYGIYNRFCKGWRARICNVVEESALDRRTDRGGKEERRAGQGMGEERGKIT